MPQIWSNRTLQGLINVRRESNEVNFFITIFCIFKLFIKIKLISFLVETSYLRYQESEVLAISCGTSK